MNALLHCHYLRRLNISMALKGMIKFRSSLPTDSNDCKDLLWYYTTIGFTRYTVTKHFCILRSKNSNSKTSIPVNHPFLSHEKHPTTLMCNTCPIHLVLLNPAILNFTFVANWSLTSLWTSYDNHWSTQCDCTAYIFTHSDTAEN